jgi:hypothetical protein
MGAATRTGGALAVLAVRLGLVLSWIELVVQLIRTEGGGLICRLGCVLGCISGVPSFMCKKLDHCQFNFRGAVSFIGGAGRLIHVVKSAEKIGEAISIISEMVSFID